MGAACAHRVRGARLRTAAPTPGAQHGIANVGYRAIDTLRMEKGYLYWSTDITPDTTPWEAGLGWRVNMEQGRLLRTRRARRPTRTPVSTRKLCTFTLEQMAYPVSGEAIIADGTVVGFTTSANFGHTDRQADRLRIPPDRARRSHRLRDRGVRRADPGDAPRRRAVRPEERQAEVVANIATESLAQGMGFDSRLFDCASRREERVDDHIETENT